MASEDAMRQGSERAEVGRPRSSLSAALPEVEFSLVELADRLLGKGVVLTGEATISVAGVDLIYLGLNALLSSVDTILKATEGRSSGPNAGQEGTGPSPPERRPETPPPSGGQTRASGSEPLSLPPAHDVPAPEGAGLEGRTATNPGDAEVAALRQEVERLGSVLPERVEVDPEGVEQGLAKLVLTLIEFLRVLLERQAVRRMEAGSLSEAEVERVGTALMLLHEKVRQIAGQFGLGDEDLNLSLGPLGTLI